MRFSIIVLLFFLSFSTGISQVRLAAIFGDHMVLQQQTDAPIWGWATPGDEVVLTTDWNGKTISTKASSYGFWETAIPTPEAGGPYSITIKADREIVLTDILIGEVWLCSGQSNMQWSLAESLEANEEIPTAHFPEIRLCHVPRKAAAHPQVQGEGVWQLTSPETAAEFSAVAYFFGKHLYKNTNTPIGLIHASWGGTPAEVWLRKELVTDSEILWKAAMEKKEYAWWPRDPGVVFNAMIHPLVPLQLAGVIWYQGESNVGTPYSYKDLMEALIQNWRSEFKKELPFYIVQIAPWNGYPEAYGAVIREQQAALLEVPNTGLVVISDQVDDIGDIHPKGKKVVGMRLANWALGNQYGKNISYRSPLFHSARFEGSKAIILFKNADDGLICKGGEANEFEIAGEDKVFYPAKAKIDHNKVILTAKKVKNPVAVRFGWANDSMPNLFNKEGLPASCFKTDDW